MKEALNLQTHPDLRRNLVLNVMNPSEIINYLLNLPMIRKKFVLNLMNPLIDERKACFELATEVRVLKLCIEKRQMLNKYLLFNVKGIKKTTKELEETVIHPNFISDSIVDAVFRILQNRHCCGNKNLSMHINTHNYMLH